jgi:transmembrane sensor
MPNMNHLNDTWKNLIEKYIANTCAKKELDQLLLMVENGENIEELSQILKDHWEKSRSKSAEIQVDLELKFSMLMQEAKFESPVFSIKSNRSTRKWKIQYAAAAIIICMFSIGAYFLFKSTPQKKISKTENIKRDKNEVVPGGNKALLTLADGSSIILDSAQNGTLTTQGNTKILTLNGMLSYNSLNKTPSVVLYNTISTPRGGQYQLVLADGSKVWLNAASSLRFPVTFVGKERKVELLGEAYFEIAKNTSMPFKVKVDEMEIEVLGTHFNINSYDDESAIRTTLLEGSVKINKNHTYSILKPGQQAQMNKAGDIRIINDADIEKAIAWKEGNFQFDRDEIHSVMQQVERWYDVDVEYKADISSHFIGTISRNVNLSQVLDMLHLTGGVNFEVKDRKIIVAP